MRKLKSLGAAVDIRAINCHCTHPSDTLWFVGNVRVKFIHTPFSSDILFKCRRKLPYLRNNCTAFYFVKRFQDDFRS